MGETRGTPGEVRPLLEPDQKEEEELARKRGGWRVAEAGTEWP